ncbi:MAG: hypothetical protein KDD01_11290 [Phaeodactylibacter sp.]|nr:hypothetical protein [Phaeodactylibacter sp.]
MQSQKNFSNKKVDTPEEWAFEVLAEPLTMGLGLDFIRGVQALFFKSVASCVTVFFRHRLGTRTLTGGTLLSGWTLLMLFWLLDQAQNRMSSGPDSSNLFWLHSLALFLVGSLHIWNSRRNLRRQDGKETPRHGDESGLSWLWPLFARSLAPFGMIYDGKGTQKWYQFTEYSFQKWVEPILAVITGMMFISAGHEMYGMVLIFAGMSMKILLQMAENQFYKAKQSTWDAEIASGLLNDSGTAQGQPEPAGMVMQRTLLKRSEKDFQKWRKQKRTEAVFATAEHRTDYHNSPAG